MSMGIVGLKMFHVFPRGTIYGGVVSIDESFFSWVWQLLMVLR